MGLELLERERFLHLGVEQDQVLDGRRPRDRLAHPVGERGLDRDHGAAGVTQQERDLLDR